ncbi:MAG: hypothetical protein FJ023_08295 [Chloroflexi bacterium]|nr:hypothetical protein [Chloroflexota bacterium]
MSAKSKSNLYLYLALVCFAGILAIFVVDGYLGLYDTLYVTVQEREQVIEPDYWQQRWVKESYEGYSLGVGWGESIPFRYEIDNRSFSTYLVDVEVSVWKGGQKIVELLDRTEVSVAPFKKTIIDWTLQSEDLGESSPVSGEYREYTVRIKRGEIERKIILSYYPVPGYPEKGPPLPIPVPETSR